MLARGAAVVGALATLVDPHILLRRVQEELHVCLLLARARAGLAPLRRSEHRRCASHRTVSADVLAVPDGHAATAGPTMQVRPPSLASPLLYCDPNSVQEKVQLLTERSRGPRRTVMMSGYLILHVPFISALTEIGSVPMSLCITVILCA